MAISIELRRAYNFHRAWLCPNGKVRFPGKTSHALDAVKKAREDLANKKPRYNSSPWGKAFAAVSWSPDKPGLAHVSDYSAAGLRLVVENAGSAKRGRNSHNGWYTNDDGESFRDGSGLIWGVVVALPHGRFYPGYVLGGFEEDSPTVDFSQAYAESDDCISIADSMAEHAAESERDYQRAYEAGRKAVTSMAAVRELGQEWLATFRALRVAFKERWQAVTDDVPMTLTRDWIRATAETCREYREEYRQAREKAFGKLQDDLPGRYDTSGRQAFWAGYSDGE